MRRADARGIFRALLSRLTRDTVRSFVRTDGRGDSGAAASFIDSQVWAYGTTGYGPFCSQKHFLQTTSSTLQWARAVRSPDASRRCVPRLVR